MIDNRTKSIPTSSSEVGIYYVYISQGNKDNGVYIVSDFVLPITVTKIAELYIGDSTKANLDGGNIFNGDQIINGDIIIQDITANNFLGNASTATKLKTFVNINGVAFDGSSNITIYDSTKEATISVGTVFQYFRGDKTWQTLNKIVVGLSNVDNTADANKNVLSATKLTIPRTINNVSFDGSENIVINAIDITPRIPMSYMGISNGVATLDSNGIIPITQLPSYVDDVIEVANYASLPIIGESGKIYVTTNNNKIYRWSGSVYVYITSGAVDSVNGHTGVVVLTKSDFILGNVDNTSDANKPISIATQSALDLKQNLLTLGNFTSTTPGVTISNGNGAVIGSGITFNITTAGATTGGIITSGHWNTFNNKWDSSNHPITTLGYGLPDYPTTLPASDVYSWAKQSTKPTYAYSEITSKPTLLSQFTNDLGNYGSWITGINSGMVTTALGYTPLPTRTFGTAASNNTGDFYASGSTVANSTLWNGAAYNLGNLTLPNAIMSTNGINWGYSVASDIKSFLGLGSSAYTNTNDHILNQNTSAQSANMWITGSIKTSFGVMHESNATNVVVGDNTLGGYLMGKGINSGSDDGSILLTSRYSSTIGAGNAEIKFRTYNGSTVTTLGTMTRLGVFNWNGAATFASTVNAAQFGATGSNAFNGYNEGWINLYSSDNSHRLRINNSSTYNRIDFYDSTLDRYADIKANVGEFTGQIKSTVATGTAPLTVNSTTVVSNLNADLLRGYSPAVFHRHLGGMLSNQDFNTIGIGISENPGSSSNNSPAGAYGTLNTISTDSYYGWQMFMESNGSLYNRSKQVSGWQPWRKIYDSGNLTNTLSTNSIPKWNGSSFVNSLISDDGTYINTFGKLDTNLEFKTGSNRYIGFGSVTNWNYYLASSGDDLRVYDAEGADFIKLFYGGGARRVSIPLTTASTSPTTGALVVGGGMGVGGTINATNYIGKSNGFYTVQITQAAYTALGTKDASTIYMIVG